MPRPKLHSDDVILDAALAVLLRKGPTGFTLSDVAASVGISRAALIQRFSGKATIHRQVMERLTQEVRDYFASASVVRGLREVETLLTHLIQVMGSGSGMEGYLLLMWGDIRDPELRRLAAERNRLVREAIADRLPSGPLVPEEAAGLIQAVMQGACMQWLIEPEGELGDFMRNRTVNAISHLYPEPGSSPKTL